MKTVTVTLASKSYTIEALSIKKSRAWREQFSAPFGQIVAMFTQTQGVDLTRPEAVGQLLSGLKDLLLGSTDIVVRMIFAYAPQLEADRDYIEEHGTDDEAVAALLEVLKLAYPFGGVLSLVQTGLTAMATSKNSHSQSGEKTPTT